MQSLSIYDPVIFAVFINFKMILKALNNDASQLSSISPKSYADNADINTCSRYIGKVGTYIEKSRLIDGDDGAVKVNFANDFSMYVPDSCVEVTDDPITIIENLPATEQYAPLNEDEKAFVDKVFLTLLEINGRRDAQHRQSANDVFDRAITLAIYRTEAFGLSYLRD